MSLDNNSKRENPKEAYAGKVAERITSSFETQYNPVLSQPLAEAILNASLPDGFRVTRKFMNFMFPKL